MRIQRSISTPLRDRDMEFDERWKGPDQGLILCWENGRRLCDREPELAKRAKNGELIVLGWKGGVEKKLKVKKKPGTWKYYATWLGLRGEDLDITFEDEKTVTCTKTGQDVLFSSRPPEDEDEATE